VLTVFHGCAAGNVEAERCLAIPGRAATTTRFWLWNPRHPVELDEAVLMPTTDRLFFAASSISL